MRMRYEMKCPKCGSEDIVKCLKGLDGVNGCCECPVVWTDWQQSEISRLTIENAMLKDGSMVADLANTNKELREEIAILKNSKDLGPIIGAQTIMEQDKEIATLKAQVEAAEKGLEGIRDHGYGDDKEAFSFNSDYLEGLDKQASLATETLAEMEKCK